MIRRGFEELEDGVEGWDVEIVVARVVVADDAAAVCGSIAETDGDEAAATDDDDDEFRIVEPRKFAKCMAAIVVHPLQSPLVQHLLYNFRIVISGSILEIL